VFRSKDGGDTWEQAGYGMDPNEAINDLLPDPNRPGLIYASTMGSGVYYTTNRGDSWTLLNEGIGSLWVDQMALSDDGSVLYAGTRVSGVIRLGMPTGTAPQAEVPDVQEEAAQDQVAEPPPKTLAGRLCKGAVAPAIVIPALLFVAAHRRRAPMIRTEPV
jgi:hypothetical protein